MQPMAVGEAAAWNAESLRNDRSWVFPLDERAQRDLIGATRKAHERGKPLFEYRRADFDFGSAWPVLAAAFRSQRDRHGIVLLRGLPREGVTPEEFGLMTWGIGLHAGVARPQGKATQYMSEVKNAGNDYRSATGRGYNSDAELDFHIDGCDVVLLSCYNVARSGGESYCTSSTTVHNLMLQERPELLEALYQPFPYSRQGENAPDERAFFTCPIYDVQDGVLFGRWNRNRLTSALKLEGVPPLTPKQAEAVDVLDSMLRRPEVMNRMWMQPGDAQLMNNHVVLHSRSRFEDFEEPEKKRLLFRLWLAPPDSRRLPPGWKDAFRQTEPGTVRGGIRGHHWDEKCQTWEARQAAELGMTFIP